MVNRSCVEVGGDVVKGCLNIGPVWGLPEYSSVLLTDGVDIPLWTGELGAVEHDVVLFVTSVLHRLRGGSPRDRGA